MKRAALFGIRYKRVYRFLKRGFRTFRRRLRTQGSRVTLLWLYGQGWARISRIPVFHYSRITPDLYVGPQYGPAGKRKLERAGIRAVINMRIEYDDAAHGLALPHYYRVPTIDGQAPPLEFLNEGVDFIRYILGQGGSVYIHCRAGNGRAPTMAAAYLISQGLSLAEALDLIRKSRPFIDILPAQLVQLQRFEDIYKKQRRFA
jgi:protein tyrosine phosphatase (PTP) superfamily phosphohydrolase (DUF442 family)